jgi:DNA-binding transcriptional ArsR family regulator
VHPDKWGLFKLHKGKHIYSSAPNFADTDLLLRTTAAHVEVRKTDNSHIVTHPRLYGGENEHMEHFDYVPCLKFIARKPRSFSNIPIREMMPTDLVSYLDSLPNGERGRILSELAVSAVEKGFGEAVDILYMRLKNEFTADQGSSPAESSQSKRLDIPYALEGLREKKNSR